MSATPTVKVAILWHMHQPNYQVPNSNRMVLPWVRLHAVKDYLDMPLMAAKYDRIRTTFNLVPSLLDQFELYCNGGSDPHLILSRINAEDLNESQKIEILDSFFAGNPPTMIEPHPRFRELYHKAKAGYEQRILPALFSSEEIRDLQVWSNLCWIDPAFHDEQPVRSLLDKGRHFQEEEKHDLLDWQIGLMNRIVPTFQDLFNEGRIDISFTPYYHPILPLLCDTDVAREATPRIELPQKRFLHPEDARHQIRTSIDKFQDLFNAPLKGMWPSEGGISEEAAMIMAEEGVTWTATDEEILYCSLKKGGVSPEGNLNPTVYNYGSNLKIFFRNHSLSDRIGFVYSGWDAERSVADFIENIKQIRNNNIHQLDRTVVPVILDGENAWEYFPRDGQDFLEELYHRLHNDSEIELVTLSEAADTIPAQPLPSLFAGSWINHNFRIWIGHVEDNAAWDLLSKTRDQLVAFEKEHPDFDPREIKRAWEQIYIAEGSDWCWWFGDEHRGEHNEQFDAIFRQHLKAVYECLDLEIPGELFNPIYKSETVYESLVPDALLTPGIDGRLTHFYEWMGAGVLDVGKTGDTAHRVDRHFAKLYYAYDHDYLYIRLDFANKRLVELLQEPTLVIDVKRPVVKTIKIDFQLPGLEKVDGLFECAADEIMEIALNRGEIIPEGAGLVQFSVALLEGDNELEVLPSNSSVSFELPEKDREFFWPV